ncbi:transcription factor Ovo-like 2 [Mustelus asterias]
MPRAFLVKRKEPYPEIRDWNQLPDEERADTYIPVNLSCFLSYQEERASEDPAPGTTGLDKLLNDSEERRLPYKTEPDQENAEEQVLGSEFKKRSVLRTKIKITSGECSDATFRCQVCSKGFRLQRMLNRHLKCHSQVKRHLCTYCGKGFNDTFDLKRHVRTHTGIRPYKCSLCHKAFTQRCSLESHLKKIHGVTQKYNYKERRAKLYVCEECGFTAMNQEDLYLHMKQNHPENPLLKKTSKKVAAALQNKLNNDENKDSEQEPKKRQ